jgi:hypothetical protein
MKCPNYHEQKDNKNDAVKVISSQAFSLMTPEKYQCPMIKSIDENLPTDFGKEYREKFCYCDFKDCKYKEATDVF